MGVRKNSTHLQEIWGESMSDACTEAMESLRKCDHTLGVFCCEVSLQEDFYSTIAAFPTVSYVQASGNKHL